MDKPTKATTNVFVTNYQERDFGPAASFGECIFITKAYVILNDIQALQNKLKAHVLYSKATDYVILTGPSVLIAMWTALWLAKHGYMNVLAWNKKDKEYLHYVIGMPPETS